MTFEERAAVIEQLARKHAADDKLWREQRAQHEAAMRAMDLALQAYVDAVLVAPWRALIQELRR